MGVRPIFLVLHLASAFLLLYQQAGAAPRVQDTEQALEDRITSRIEASQLDAALDEARRAVVEFPRSSTLHHLLGAALFKKGLNGEARVAFRRAIELAPSLPQNYFNLALIDLSEKQYSAAAKSLETCLRLEPTNAQARLLLGRAYHNLNRTEPAIEQFKKALEQAPQLPLAHYHLGYAYQSQGNLQAALDDFRKEIESNPSFSDSYWLAGNIELGRGNLDAAEDLFRKGLRLKPQAFQGRYGLARVLMARCQFPEAESELKKAVGLNPGSVEAHYALARTYQELGRKEDARREYEVVASLHARSQSQRSGIAGRQP